MNALNLNTSDIPLKSIEDLLHICLPFLNYIWVFMAIDINALSCFFALVSEFRSEPSMGSRFSNRPLDAKCRENNIIDMLTQDSRVYSAEILACKINTDIVQEGFVVEEGVMTMPNK